MLKNEVNYHSQRSRLLIKTKIVLILVTILLISPLNSISSNNSFRNSKTKTKNKILSKLNRSLNQRSTVRVKTELTQNDIKEIIEAHNDLRNQVAMGKTSKGNSLSQAGNMLQVYWSSKIAKGAQEWANRCAMNHSPRGQYTFNSKGLGENIAFRGFSGNESSSPFTQFVNDWFNEINDYNGNVGNFQNTGGPVIGHFTQVSWAESYLIGCGYCKTNKGGMTEEYLVCQYYNQGNYIGQPIYQVKNGNQCQCPHGYACKNKDYQGLCCPDAFNWCQKGSILWTE